MNITIFGSSGHFNIYSSQCELNYLSFQANRVTVLIEYKRGGVKLDIDKLGNITQYTLELS